MAGSTATARTRSHPLTLVGLSVVSAATTLVALLSWSQFTQSFGSTLWPLVVVAVVVVASGAAARWWRVPRPLVVVVQLVLVAIVVSTAVTGSPLPVGEAWDRLLVAFQDAVTSANQYAPPVPAGAAPVHPLLIAGGAGLLLLVDVLACTVRRVPLAGLPLLAVYSVPVSMAADGPHWFLYLLTAVGFLSMIFLSEAEQVARWGPVLVEDRGASEPKPLSVPGWPRTGARAIGGIATVLSVAVPLALPAYSVHLFDFGPGAGGDDDISIENPMLDLRRDLLRGEDVPLVEVRTDDPDPRYLRIAVLNRFRDEEWTSGNREVPSTQVAEGTMPGLVGVSTRLTRNEYEYQLSATRAFRSTWLPTTPLTSRVDATGDWRYDTSTMDFLASDDDLTTAGLDWDFTGVKLDYDANALATAGPTGALVDRDYLDVPEDLDPVVEQLAQQVTAEAPSKFEKAVALQQWFRSEFTYDDSVNLGNGTDDLVRFLSPGAGGRRGYCEQFAASMAVMARQLGIPARVAVGFLRPEQTGPDTYEYSAHDLHAWPELFFSGSGWVRFEPTPDTRAEGVPSYTTQEVTVGEDTATPSASAGPVQPTRPRDSAATEAQQQEQDQADAGTEEGGFPWLLLLGLVVLLALVVVALLAPSTIRRRRREQRAQLGPEDAWAELHDTALDLGLPWPRDRSPRQTRDALVQLFGPGEEAWAVERPRRGPDVNPDAVAALDKLVEALERLRYARADGTSPGTWRAEVQSCVEALQGGVTRRARRTAAWWPRSVFRRTPPAVPVVGEREDALAGRVVDHVG